MFRIFRILKIDGITYIILLLIYDTTLVYWNRCDLFSCRGSHNRRLKLDLFGFVSFSCFGFFLVFYGVGCCQFIMYQKVL